jgi:nucleoside-diphosphate-sugar epimerase
VLWDISQKILHQPEIRLFGTGAETRDFIHAQDTANGLLLLLERAAFQAEAYNLANGQSVSICALTQALLRAFSCDKPMLFSGQTRPGDPTQWQADIRSIQALGYQPTCPFESGVQEYAQWVLKMRNDVPESALRIFKP